MAGIHQMIMSAFSQGGGGIDVGDIGHSLRFRGAPYLNRTPVNPAILNKWTMSFWIKRGALGSKWLGGCGTVIGNSFVFGFNASDQLAAAYPNTGATLNVATSAVFRDPTAFIHVVMNCFLGNATPADRFQFWANGVRLATPTYVFTAALNFNNNQPQQIGQHPVLGLPVDGYMSRIAFVDQAQLTPSSFGYFNTTINEWVSKSQSAVKAVVDAGGVNSFMLDFDNATSLTTLGNDFSSKNNDWTLNSFSLTAGVTYDHMLDVPGNSYPVLNPIAPSGGGAAGIINGNLSITNAVAVHHMAQCSMPMSSGKWEFQGSMVSVGPTNYAIFGIVKTPGSFAAGQYPGSVATSFGILLNSVNAASYTNSVATNNTAGSYNTATVLRCAVDLDAGKVWLGFNTTWLGGGNPAAGTSPTYTFTGGQEYVFVCSCYQQTTNPNFGQQPLGQPLTTGFKALCQANLPTPAILNPEAHFDVKLWSGTNASPRNITGLPFAPELVWIKERTSAQNHFLWDVLSGAGNNSELATNLTAAMGGVDANIYGYLSAFNSDGFTIAPGTDPTYHDGAFNYTGGAAVAWNWKAGGTPTATNVAGVGSVPTAGSVKIDGADMTTALAGTIVATKLSANTKAGFSIVNFTPPASGICTFAHGLGKAPTLVITKGLTGVTGWTTYHAGLGNTAYVQFTTAAAVTLATAWNNTSPTDDVVTLGTTFQNLGAYQALCFTNIEGFSKIGSYVGNGLADGPYIECGFKPKFVLVKRSDAAYDWHIFDSTREPENTVNLALYPSGAYAETSDARDVDFLSSGFKLRQAVNNVTSGTYIFIAFADVPAKYSLAR